MSEDLAIRSYSETALMQQDPEAEVEWASRCARALVKAINGNPQLKVRIGQHDYIKVEGWQTLGAMTKVDHVDVVWCREYVPPGATLHNGWEARVEVRDRAGNVRGTGEAMCVRSENRWRTADEYAIRSMAQTRALGKAYRMALSYVVALAGYEPTPAEEMPQFAPDSGLENKAGVLPAADPLPSAPVSAEPLGEQPSSPDATPAQRKKLDVLVGSLRDAGHITTENLYTACERDGVGMEDEDGKLHWSPLRDSLSKDQASGLIERLQTFANTLAAA